MKKTAITIALLAALAAWGLAVDLSVGLNYGGRSVNSADIRDVYGSGSVFFPYANVRFWKGLSLGLGYEGGYSRSGKIGIYEEDSDLRVSGFELFASYIYPVKKLSPYARLGIGSYSYKQTIDSEYATEKVDSSKVTVSLAVGARFQVFKGLFVSVDLRYVPLKVKPVDETVDLGGIRYSLGVGYTFSFVKGEKVGE